MNNYFRTDKDKYINLYSFAQETNMYEYHTFRIDFRSILKGKRHFLKRFTLAGGGLAILVGILWIFL